MCSVGTALNLDLIFFLFSCLLVLFINRVVYYMGLLQFALGLSNTKGESPRDSYSTKQRENPVYTSSFWIHLH